MSVPNCPLKGTTYTVLSFSPGAEGAALSFASAAGLGAAFFPWAVDDFDGGAFDGDPAGVFGALWGLVPGEVVPCDEGSTESARIWGASAAPASDTNTSAAAHTPAAVGIISRKTLGDRVWTVRIPEV